MEEGHIREYDLNLSFFSEEKRVFARSSILC